MCVFRTKKNPIVYIYGLLRMLYTFMINNIFYSFMQTIQIWKADIELNLLMNFTLFRLTIFIERNLLPLHL